MLASMRGQPRILTTNLTLLPSELTSAENLITAKNVCSRSGKAESQSTSAPSTHQCLAASNSKEGLLQVGGRLSNTTLLPSQRHPIILSGRDPLAKMLFEYDHLKLSHCGPTLFLAHEGARLHVLGARRLARYVCKSCVPCRKAAARVETQLMGQLPSTRVTPSPPFSITGIDYAGPFVLKKGHTKKPVLVKAYLALFVCLSTKAVHLEIVSDLTTEAFIATLKRFVSRRGLPKEIHTDDGTNFQGARNDLSLSCQTPRQPPLSVRTSSSIGSPGAASQNALPISEASGKQQ